MAYQYTFDNLDGVQMRLYFGTTGAYYYCCQSIASMAIGTHVFMVLGSTSGSTESYDHDGTPYGTLAKTSGTFTPNSFTASASVEANANVTVGEILVYNRALVQSEYQKIEGYLACKWGTQSLLPNTHPYYSTCPSGSSIPTTISNLAAWYDASNASTITTVPLISQMTDKSGSGNTLTQSTQSSQPYVTTISGQQALEFSGAQMLSSSTTNTLVTGSNPSSMFLVAGSETGSAPYPCPLAYGALASHQSRAICIYNNTSSLQLFTNEYSGQVNATTLPNQPALYYSAFGSTVASGSVDGALLISGSLIPNTAGEYGSDLWGISNGDSRPLEWPAV